MKNRRKQNPNGKAADATPPTGFAFMKPETVLLVLAIPFGLFMVFVTPPFQSPDEYTHLFRAFQLSEGTVVAEREANRVGGTLPLCLQDAAQPFTRLPFHPEEKVNGGDVSRLLKEPFTSQPRIFMEFMHTAIYSPVVYAPATVGVWISRALGLSALKMLYVSRLATFVCWLAVVLVAIRVIPVFKWVTLLLALMPMSIFVAASPSADVLTNALAMLLAALMLRSALTGKGPLNWKEGLAIVVMCVLVAATKQLYFLLALMALMIPKERFASAKYKVLFCIGALGAAILVNLAWAWTVRNVVVTEAWADPNKQTAFVLAHPWEYVRVLGNTLSIWWQRYIEWYVGVLGWLDTWLPSWVYPTYVAMLIGAAILDAGHGRPITTLERLLLAAIVLVTLLLVATSQYITYTIPGDAAIRGIQGRYFIPLTIPMLLVLYNRKLKLPQKPLSIAVTAYCAVVLLATCLSMLNRYYGINPLGLEMRRGIM
jgi:uncharacterized membrane protein